MLLSGVSSALQELFTRARQHLRLTLCLVRIELKLRRFRKARWKTRGRGHGVRGSGVWKTRGVENTGSGGKRGVWWKTRGVVENTGSTWKTQGSIVFRQNMNFPHNNESMR